LLVDITGQHRDDHFETRGGHRKIQDKLEMRIQTGGRRISLCGIGALIPAGLPWQVQGSYG
jgi:hypothetical protein